MRDILIFTPMLRLEPETVWALMTLRWDGPLSLLIQKDNPSGDGVLDQLHQYQRGREAFLRGPYEGMLVIESDIVPPADVLQGLAALDCDVAYGAYRLRVPGAPVVNIFERYAGEARNPGESLLVRGLWAQACAQGVVECSAGGLGCVLIRRRVLEAIDFRSEDHAWCDTFWARDVLRAGFSMKADTRIRCEHIDVDGTVLIVPEA